MNTVLINRSGESQSVSYGPMEGPVIGTIYNNEVYTAIPQAPLNGSPYPVAFYGVSTKIMFRNSSGQIAVGYLNHPEGGDNTWTDYQEPYHYFGFYGFYDGSYLYRFNIRGSDIAVLNNNGGPATTLNSGDYVCCSSSRSGDAVTNLLQIQKYRKSNVWNTLTNGYVDYGLNQGSMPGTIPVYGTLG